MEELKPPRASKNLIEYWEQAQMSKVLATIETHADIEFDLEKARYGNPYTQEAHAMFQRLQFKNMLSRFDVETVSNQIEDVFREVTDPERSSCIPEACAGGACRRCFFKRSGKCTSSVCPSVGIRAIALAWGEDSVVTIPCDMDTDMEALFGQVSEIAGKVKRFSMCGLKEALPYLPGAGRENAFDVIVAAYPSEPAEERL